ncbi:MAG: DUF6599 family protein [Terriglobia bacterium]
MSAFYLLRRAVLCLMLVLILAGSRTMLAGQKDIIIPLVPVSNWNLVSSTKLTFQDLSAFGDQLPVDHEYGVQAAVERTYQLGYLKATAVLEEAADPSSAYGLYTFYQNESMRSTPGIQMAAIGSHDAVMTRGRYFIHVLEQPNSSLSAQDLHSLLVKIGGKKLSEQNIESLPAPLPRQGLVPGTEKYLLGVEAASRVLGSFPVNVIGFQDGVEVQTGVYRVGSDRLKLIEISYPTPQLAERRFETMQRALQINQGQGVNAVFGRQEGSYALLVMNAPTKALADRLLGQFGVAETVSWNARYRSQAQFTYQVLQLVIANLELVFILGGFAILGGVFIFVAKKLIMKFFPNSPWPRPDEEELTRLNLS